MHSHPRHSSPSLLVLAAVLLASCFLVSAPAGAEDLDVLFEEMAGRIFGQIDDFAIAPCDPPCPGKICCDNGVCVSTVLACGFYPIHIDSFRAHGTPRAQMAGFATQGVLAAEYGREARLWFGSLDGEDWLQLGVQPGDYELVLEAGATSASAFVLVKDQDGAPVARMSGHFWVFSSATSGVEAAPAELDWTLSAEDLVFQACHAERCVVLSVDVRPGS